MARIKEDYVSFETAKLLKEKGFEGYSNLIIYDENAANTYIKELQEKHLPYSSDDPKLKEFYYTKPTLQMAMKWLREIHNIHITVHPGVSEYGFVWTYAIVFVKEVGKGETYFYKISQITTPIVKSKSYEQACEEAIKYCLEKLI